MIRSFVAAVVVACVLILAPTGKSEKEIGSASASPLTETMTDLLFATVQDHPCAIIVMASNEASPTLPKSHVESKVKKKTAHGQTKHKKKNHRHHHTTHHHSPDSSPQKIFGAHGPLHLTSPPGCG